ncbi:MAG: MotA/TolQ/ExbB proton channel family protein [Pseudomonadota bacterium]
MNQAAMNEPIINLFARIFETLGTGWVIWLLIALSIASLAIMIERALFYRRNTLGDVKDISDKLIAGDLDGALRAVGDKCGLEAEVLRQAMKGVARGAEAVEEIVRATIVRERLNYERYLAYLGTLGNNAPFIGLFGTVLGIIKAFAALAVNAKAGAVTGGATNIMTGISEALVATALGLMVAIPAVAVYNGFGRWLKTIVARSEVIGHALSSHLKTVVVETEHAAQRR